MFPGQFSPDGFFPGDLDPSAWVPACMPPPTDEQLIRGPRVDLARVTLMIDGVDVAVLPLTAGRMDAQSDRPVRRMMSADIPGLAQWIPNSATSRLDPRSFPELRLELGVSDPRAGEFWWPQGIFGLTRTSLTLDDKGAGLVLDCPDRAYRVSQARMAAALTIPSGTSVEAGVAMVLGSAAPWLPLRLSPSHQGLPETVVGSQLGADPWAEAQKLAQAGGCELYMARDGVAEMRQVRDALSRPIDVRWQTESESIITQLTRELDGSEQPTGIIVPYGAQGQEQQVVVVPEGQSHLRRVMYDGDTSLLATKDQAVTAGQAQLLKRAGLVEQVAGTVLADPRLDVGDVAQVSAWATLGLRIIARITGLAWTFGEPTMTFRLAERRLQ